MAEWEWSTRPRIFRSVVLLRSNFFQTTWRAYAMEGDAAKVRPAYQDFFTLWKDADPDILVLKEAKAEYVKLAVAERKESARGSTAEWTEILDSQLVNKDVCIINELTAPKWALNSAVECHLHTVEVIGSNPIAPTIELPAADWNLSPDFGWTPQQ